MTGTLNIVDVRRVAAANGATEARTLAVAERVGATVHRINGKPFLDVQDEARVSKAMQEGRSNA